MCITYCHNCSIIAPNIIFSVFFLACNAYLADITDPKHRTKRVAFMTGCYFIGYNIGKALAGVIKEELGFMYNFGFGMGVAVLTGVYAIVFLKDSASIREKRLEVACSKENTEPDLQDKKDIKDIGEQKEMNKYNTLEKLGQLFSIKQVQDGVK